MSDRLPRSNSQSHLPNYSQGQSNEKNRDVDKKKDGAPARSDKNTGRGESDKNKAAPQMKSKEEKKIKAPSENDSDDGGKVPDTFGRLFLGKGASAIARKYGDSDESSSEDGTAPSDTKTLKSARQQQSAPKEKNANSKVPKLSLKNLGNMLGSLASDRHEMTISPRKTNRETHRNTQDSIASPRNTAATAGTSTANTTATTTTTATTANTAVGNAAIPHTTTVVTVPLWQPASPRFEWHTTSQSNLPASAKSKDTNTTITSTTTSPASWTPTSPRSKSSSNTQSPTEKTTTQKEADTKASVANGGKNTSLDAASEDTVSKTATAQKKVVGNVYADDLSEQSIKTINHALSGNIVSGADLAELLVCFQSCGYKNPMVSSSLHSILRPGMTVRNFPDPKNPKTTIDVNIIEKISEPFIKTYYDTPKIDALRIAAMQKYDECNLKLPEELRKESSTVLRDNKTYANAMRPLVKMVSKEILGETMNLSVAPMSDEVKELLKGIDAGVIRWSKAVGGVDKETLILARKSAISAYVAVRSFVGLWFTAFAKDPALKKYIQMTSYLTTMLTTRSDKFYYSVMSNAVDQDNEQKQLVEQGQNATAFSSLGKPKKVKGKQFATSEQRAERRAIKKEVQNFLTKFDEFWIDSNFSEYLQTIIASSKDKNLPFRENPAQFVLDHLDDYWFSMDSTNGDDLFIESSKLNILKKQLEIEIESDKANDSGRTTISTATAYTTTTTNATTTTNTTTTTTNTNPTQASSEGDTSPRRQ